MPLAVTAGKVFVEMSVVDIFELQWLDAPSRLRGCFNARTAELEDGSLLFVDYDHELNRSSISMEAQGGKWHRTSDTADWPFFDDMFGRESWQEFARSHSRNVRAEELAERVEELEAECNSRVSRSQLERAKSMMEEGYNAEGALTRVASVNAELHPAQESHHYDFVRFVDADGHYLVGDDGSMGVYVKPSEDWEPYDVAAREWLCDCLDGAWLVDSWL